MFGYSRSSPALSANLSKIDHRVRLLEQGLGRAGSRAASGASGTADYISDAVAAVLNSLAGRFNNVSISDEAAKFGEEAARLGNDALRRFSHEVEHRPLVTLGVAVGVGVLVGMVVNRR